MATRPIELAYQPGQIVYCIRVSELSVAPIYVYNQATGLYEIEDNTKWNTTNYLIALTEVLPGIYRATCPANSTLVQATEYFYTVRTAGGSITNADPTIDAPHIGTGNSQGVDINAVGNPNAPVNPNPTADLAVANMALMLLGQHAITSFVDGSVQALAVNTFYANDRDEVLRKASWKFASVISSLTQLPNEAIVGWAYIYAFPTDAVTIRKVFYQDSSYLDYPYFWNWYQNTPPPLITNPMPQEFRVIYQEDIDALVLACNFNPAYVEYTARIDDPSVYDAMFIKCLAYKLASDIAVVLNSDKEVTERMNQKYEMFISEAARVNGNEDQVPNREQSSYLDAR